MSSFLDTLHNETKFLQQSSRHLDILANAFEITGNRKMADALCLISTDIDRSIKVLTEAYAGKVHEDMVRAEESTANLVKTALGVVKGKL